MEFWFDGSWVKPGYRWPVEGIYRTIKSREPQCQIGINWTIGEDADPHNPNAPEKSYKIIPEEQKEGDPIRYFPSDFRLGDPLLPASLIREFDFKKTGWSWWPCTLQVSEGPARRHGRKSLRMASLCE